MNRRFHPVQLIVILFFTSIAFFITIRDREKVTYSAHFSAAASLKEVMDEMVIAFERVHPSYLVTVDYGGSGAIREKVLSGAPIDGIFLASQEDIQKLDAGKVLENQQVLLQNRLVAVTAENNLNTSYQSLTQLLSEATYIAIGEPNTVPAGSYAMEALTQLVALETIEEKFVFGSDVRQVLSYVESVDSVIGFVYQTDVVVSSNIGIVAVIDSSTHAPILYSSGLVRTDAKNPVAVAFNEFLASDSANDIYRKYGFELYEGETRSEGR
ncbi:molybdate ABC transporter, periplasmic molybdate-binding protein [Enterococcus sp. 8G7_MSG3316]|uniref:Molybdate ABC transporter, periplasmic molybdate-binding protein n=1 Tax=Candidatus Enterococcus testudinis TaxID=1834191 RepID=A0A242A4L0_9ENTE|nr:molybdate ABC transporter substrate-binding protein [Enterococcus sp. 8G7_MSG3316]OTN75978.1 molybdate ABC transporter, periplasmic molybdate-binding protein [Enterococcus sp. 8G7_MSG3316]